MSKRKAGVYDIIYELDNDDIEISSDDEAKETKIQRTDTELTDIHIKSQEIENEQEAILVSDSPPSVNETQTNTALQNGGKTSSDEIIDDKTNFSEENSLSVEIQNISDSEVKSTTILNEDIVIDSPTSNSELCIASCENRKPLVSVKFKTKMLAANYKKKLKTFMLNLIKLHEVDSSDLDSDTDLELDIWPEDLTDDVFVDDAANSLEDDLFFVDTAPCVMADNDIPAYSQASSLISNKVDKEPTPPLTLRRGPVCFNCDGPHQLRLCDQPKNSARIAENRKLMANRVGCVGRYHVEDEQKFGHMIPGRISGQLRHALGLKRHQLPLHIYRMRLLGYPPGWLEEARISHSGITMFDSTGSVILDPEEEDGEISDPRSKDKYDIKKILDFPGFNVPASSRYKEESHLNGLPPMSDQDSKITMLQMLAPNAMKAYKRKKLTLFPSAPNCTTTQETEEMELDSGDETAVFPSVPPLPDEAPPPVLPPPPPPVLPPPPPPGSPSVTTKPPLPPQSPPFTPSPSKFSPETPSNILDVDKILDEIEDSSLIADQSHNDLQIEQEINDVSTPNSELNEVVESVEDKVQTVKRASLSLDDLEKKKLILLNALEGEEEEELLTNTTTDDLDNKTLPDNGTSDSLIPIPATNIAENEGPIIEENPDKIDEEVPSCSVSVSTPQSKAGRVKTTSYGTPVMNIASSYLKLPSDDKFAKDICDVINFENLPNSTGKYKQICSLLKKVKTEVDRIQES